MVLRLHLLLAPLALLLLARNALAGQCMVSGNNAFELKTLEAIHTESPDLGDCVITGTTDSQWNDDW